MSQHGLPTTPTNFKGVWSKALAAILVLFGAMFAIYASQGTTDLERASEALEPFCGDLIVADRSLLVALERENQADADCWQALRNVAGDFGVDAVDFDDLMARDEASMRSEQARLAVSAFEIDRKDHALEVIEVSLTDCTKSLIEVDVASASLEDPGIALWTSACDHDFLGKRHIRWIAN